MVEQNYAYHILERDVGVDSTIRHAINVQIC